MGTTSRGPDPAGPEARLERGQASTGIAAGRRSVRRGSGRGPPGVAPSPAGHSPVAPGHRHRDRRRDDAEGEDRAPYGRAASASRPVARRDGTTGAASATDLRQASAPARGARPARPGGPPCPTFTSAGTGARSDPGRRRRRCATATTARPCSASWPWSSGWPGWWRAPIWPMSRPRPSSPSPSWSLGAATVVTARHRLGPQPALLAGTRRRRPRLGLLALSASPEPAGRLPPPGVRLPYRRPRHVVRPTRQRPRRIRQDHRRPHPAPAAAADEPGPWSSTAPPGGWRSTSRPTFPSSSTPGPRRG